MFRDLIRDTRAQLAAVYASDATDDGQARGKRREAFAAMREAYERAKAGEPGLAGYDRWFAGYAQRRPEQREPRVGRAVHGAGARRFARCWREEGGDLPRFYARVKEIGALPKARAR